MNKRKRINKVALLVMAASLSSCSLSEIEGHISNAVSVIVDYGSQAAGEISNFVSQAGEAIAEGFYTVCDNVSHFAQEAYETISAKAQELVGDVGTYLAGLDQSKLAAPLNYSEQSEYVIKDLPEGEQFQDPYALNHVDEGFGDTEKFATYYLSSILTDYGYTVCNAAAFAQGNVYSGLLYFAEEELVEINGESFPSCGFMQIIGENYEGETINEQIVQGGLIACPTYNNEDIDKKNAYIVNKYTTLNSFAGIYKGAYFEFNQSDNYVGEMKLWKDAEAKRSKSIDIYDFDNEVEIAKGKPSINDVVAEFSEDRPNEYCQSVITSNAIADITEASGNGEAVTNVVAIDGNMLENAAKEGGNSILNTIKSWYKSSILADNQFFCFTDNGIRFLGKEYDIDKERTTNGIISTIGSALALTGACASLVIGFTAGGPVIKAIVLTTATSSIAYNVSNMIEGIQNIYYGSKNDKTEAENPVLKAFTKIIGDEKTAKIVYHAWGIGTTLISGLMNPVTKALSISRCKGLNVFQTFGYVLRASLVTIVKAGVAALGAAMVGNYVNKVVSFVTDERCMGNLAGFGASLVTGILVFKGLDWVDKKLNISGLYPKLGVKKAFEYEEANRKKEIVDNEKFKSMSRGDKEDAIRMMADAAADKYGIENPPKIKLVYDWNTANCGGYNPSTNTIEVNLLSSDSATWADVANTIGHEMWHCHQYEYAAMYPDSEIAYSLRNYISPARDGSNYNAYINQLCEAEAWKMGDWFSNFFCMMFL